MVSYTISMNWRSQMMEWFCVGLDFGSRVALGKGAANGISRTFRDGPHEAQTLKHPLVASVGFAGWASGDDLWGLPEEREVPAAYSCGSPANSQTNWALGQYWHISGSFEIVLQRFQSVVSVVDYCSGFPEVLLRSLSAISAWLRTLFACCGCPKEVFFGQQNSVYTAGVRGLHGPVWNQVALLCHLSLTENGWVMRWNDTLKNVVQAFQSQSSSGKRDHWSPHSTSRSSSYSGWKVSCRPLPAMTCSNEQWSSASATNLRSEVQLQAAVWE